MEQPAPRPPPPEPDAYRFGGYTLDPARGVLRDARGGEAGLRPKTAELLRHLAEKAGRVVSRDELMRAVWPDVVVTDESISQCVFEIRQALGGEGARLLRTLPKRGYLLAAEVTRAEAAPTSPAAGGPGGAPAGTPPPASDRDEAHAAAPGVATPPAAERRQLTLLSCDLAGSTALAARLDPEDLQAVLQSYHRAVTAALEAQGDCLAKLLGDAVLACFGWPAAHEDDAERAVRAGLAVTEAVSRLEAPQAGPLAARVGIATGPVVVGEVLGQGEAREKGVLGEAPNLAARLQDAAGPGTVVADAATRGLTGALFEWADLGEVALKGFSGPVRAWRALGQSGVESRFEALRGAAAHLPLVGREEELDLLLRRWRRARSGDGQVVLLRGEAGIGKSRLAAALHEALQSEEHEGFVLYGSPQHTDSPLRPVVSRLERAAGLKPGDMAEERLCKLEALLTILDPPLEDVALVADLLSVPTLGRWPALDLSPQRRRERLLEALVRRVRALAARRPVLAVVEDAHWLDPTTRELLDLLVAATPGMALLLAVTHRPEFDASAWIGLPHVTPLQLNRLRRAEHAALLRRVAGKPLPAEVEAEIMARTDGVPLFAEEVTRAILEAGLLREEAGRWVRDDPLPPLAVPSSLQASLVARLDRLSSTREVAQAGAVLGREFAHDLIAEISGLPEPALREALNRLAAAELLQRRGTPPDAVYAFRHALIQDAAYGTLLRGRRRELHRRAADAIERLRYETAEREPEVLARHRTQAGMAKEAVGHWHEAARRAMARSAMAEAATHLRMALEMLPALPDTPARWRQELGLQTDLGNALAAAEGYTAPETGRAYERARELCERLGDTPALIRAASGQWSYHLMRGETGPALKIAEDLLRRAEQEDSLEGRLAAHRLAGTGMLHAGQLQRAHRYLEAAASILDRAGEGAVRMPGGKDALMGVPAYRAILLLLVGRYGQAKTQIALGLAGAERSARPHRLAFALAMALWFHSLLDEDAPQYLDALGKLAAEQGFPYWAGIALMYRGVSLARAGDIREGAALVREGAAIQGAAGAAWSLPAFLAIVAEMAKGREGHALVTEAFARFADTDSLYFEPELHRIRGVLLAGEGDAAGAEADFIRATDLARDQGAKHWELRAAIGLARLWRDQGRHAEARDLLAPVYGWFTEGFDLPDLRNAKALLDQFG